MADARNATLDPQLTGNVGLYYCCYRLSLLGWNVMPTARNARGVDIIAYSRDASRFIGVQVKALSKRYPVALGTDLDRVMGDFWVIVNKAATSTPSAFVLLPSEVQKHALRREKDGRISFWLALADYDRDPFREAWERIGHGGVRERSRVSGEGSPTVVAAPPPGARVSPRGRFVGR